MYCGRCGAEIKDKTARFCDNCGASLETGGGQNDYGSEDTYNGRGNRRNGTYSGTGTYNDGGNGTYGTYDQPYNNGGNGTYNRSHNNRGNGTYNGTYNRRTGQNQQDDNLIWDDGLPEVPDNRGNKGDQKMADQYWMYSWNPRDNSCRTCSSPRKNSGGSASDIVVNITQAPKAETSQNSTKTAKADTEEKQNTTASNQSTTKNSSTQKSVKIATPTPSAATDAQELQITNEQKPQSSSAQKKQSTVQPSKKVHRKTHSLRIHKVSSPSRHSSLLPRARQIKIWRHFEMRRYRNIPCRKKAQTAVHRVLRTLQQVQHPDLLQRQQLYTRRLYFSGEQFRISDQGSAGRPFQRPAGVCKK